jgi:hypothetical protein
MTENRILLDPTAEHTPAKRERLSRPSSLDGLTVGLLDISKARGDLFLDEVESLLTKRGVAVKRFKKPTMARVAPTELKQEITTQCDVVVEALAD